MTDEDEIKLIEDSDAKTSGITDLVCSLVRIGQSVLDSMSEEQRAKIEAEVLAALDPDDKEGEQDE